MAQSSNTATGNVSSIRLFLVAVGTFCMMLCNGIINNSTTYFIKPVSEFLGVETTTFSLYFTIITICSAIMSLVVMPMVMRIGMRISAIIACIGGICLVTGTQRSVGNEILELLSRCTYCDV